MLIPQIAEENFALTYASYLSIWSRETNLRHPRENSF
jgi:hypothetical protein